MDEPAAPPALILGFGVHGLAIARSLGRRDIRVEAIDTDQEQAHRHSRYCHTLHSADSLEDDQLVDQLLRLGRESKAEKTVLYITKDLTVPVVSEHRRALSEHYHFNLPPSSVIEDLMDKTALPDFLDRVDCTYPRTKSVAGPADLQDVAHSIGFPCILKPATRSYEFKAGVADDESQLSRLYADVADEATEIVVQELIPGEDADVYFCFAYIGRDSAPLGVFTGRKLRQYPRGTGIATSAEGCDDTFVGRETLRLFEHAGYRGFGSAEFRRDPTDGEYYLIEFTVGRTDYNVGCAIGNGVDLPYLGYRDMVGLPPVPAQSQQNDRRRWVELDRELRAIWQPEISFDRHLAQRLAATARSLNPTNIFALFHVRDPAPFLVDSLVGLLALPVRAARKIGRAVGSWLRG